MKFGIVVGFSTQTLASIIQIQINYIYIYKWMFKSLENQSNLSPHMNDLNVDFHWVEFYAIAE